SFLRPPSPRTPQWTHAEPADRLPRGRDGVPLESDMSPRTHGIAGPSAHRHRTCLRGEGMTPHATPSPLPAPPGQPPAARPLAAPPTSLAETPSSGPGRGSGTAPPETRPRHLGE